MRLQLFFLLPEALLMAPVIGLILELFHHIRKLRYKHPELLGMHLHQLLDLLFFPDLMALVASKKRAVRANPLLARQASKLAQRLVLRAKTDKLLLIVDFNSLFPH